MPYPPPLDTHSPNPSSPLEHERGGHKAGSSKQSPARPAPGEGGQAPPAAGQVSPFPFMSFFSTFSPGSSLFALSSLSVAAQRISSVPSLSFLFHPPRTRDSYVHARGASHPQCLIPPCGSSLPAVAAAAAARCSSTLPLREKTSRDYACSH